MVNVFESGVAVFALLALLRIFLHRIVHFMALPGLFALGLRKVVLFVIQIQISKTSFLQKDCAVLRARRVTGQLITASYLAQQRTGAATVVHFREVDLAIWLQVRIPQQMTFDVFIQITLLRECQFAIFLHREWARVGPLVGVNTQMIIEIMPFSEVHGTVGVIALQYLEISLRFWILKFEYPEHLGGGNVRIRLLLVYLQLLIQADFAAENDFDLVAPGWDLIENTLVLDLVAGEDYALLFVLINQWTVFAVALSVEAATAAGRCHILR